MADEPLIALRVVRVMNRPPDPLNQLNGVVFTSQLRGCDAFVKGDSRLTLGGWLAHHDDSRHDMFLPVDGPLGYHRGPVKASMAI